MPVNERKRSRKKLLRRAAVVFLILLLFTGCLLVLLHWEDQQDDFPEQTDTGGGNGSAVPDPQAVMFNGQWFTMRDNIETVLVIGLDSMENDHIDESDYENNEKSDFLMLLIIDREGEKCRVLHINRDSMADVTVLGFGGQKIDTRTEQLSLAYTYGSGGLDSCRNTAEAVSRFLYNIPIDHYVSVNMAAVPIMNDSVGGVTLKVMDDFPGDDRLIKDKTVTLKGDDALRYVRSRFGLEDSSNVHRMERQRQYLAALYDQVSDRVSSDAGFGLEILLKISDYFISDCTAQKLSDLLNTMVEYGVEGFETIEGESVVGEKYMEFYPDEDALQNQLIDLFYEPYEK